MKRFAILLIFVFFLTGCKERIYTKIPSDVVINFKETTFSVYSSQKLSDIVSESNVELIDQEINTNSLGTYELIYYFNYNNKKYQSSFSYSVVDDENPKIFGSKSKTVVVNYKGDPCNLVTYGDNYDAEPKCVVSGEYDLDKTGTYPIEISVSDSSENSASFNLTLNVVNSNSNSKSTTSTKKLQFSDAYKTYKKSNNELGIDVSKWQGDIDFTEVKNAGVSFVIIRIGVKLNSGEEPNLDSYFLQNIKNAKEAGLKVGVYLYSKSLSVNEAQQEAEWVLNALGDESLDLPIVFDWEIWSGWNSYHLSFHDLNEMAHVFINTVEAKGYKGMLYSSKFYLENFWDDSFGDIWLAHYVNNTSYSGYKIWQFSNVGRIPGINGDVDLDIMVN